MAGPAEPPFPRRSPTHTAPPPTPNLLRHPAVAEVAVIGLPDGLHGEEVCAVVVLARDAEQRPTAEELIAWSKEHLAKHKYPRRVEFVDEYPLGPSHKVLKRELRARFSR
jgi:long-chain acyl-CoA synthetase